MPCLALHSASSAAFVLPAGFEAALTGTGEIVLPLGEDDRGRADVGGESELVANEGRKDGMAEAPLVVEVGEARD